MSTLIASSALAEDGPVTAAIKKVEAKDSGKIAEITAQAGKGYEVAAIKDGKETHFVVAASGDVETGHVSAAKSGYSEIGSAKPAREVVETIVKQGYTEDNIEKVGLDGGQWDCIVSKDGKSYKVVINGKSGEVIANEEN